MPKGSIEEIKRIETEANNEIKDARKNADEKIKNAESKALAQRKQVLQKAKQDVEDLKNKTQQDTQKDVQEILTENSRIIKQTEHVATPRIDEAVTFIIKRISEGD